MNFLLRKRFSVVDLLLSTLTVMGLVTLFEGQTQAGLIMLAVGLVGGIAVEALRIDRE